MRTAGFVLVGGRSSRMGRDKALLPWRDQTLVESIAANVREAAGNVTLVGRSDLHEIISIECLSDLRPGLGPLSGIETALASGRGDLNLIHACDLFVPEAYWLNRLLRTAEASRAKCVVTVDENGRVHPLCGVYHADCLQSVQTALADGRLRLMDLIAEFAAEQIQLPGPIWNVNTPEDWQALQEVANGW